MGVSHHEQHVRFPSDDVGVKLRKLRLFGSLIENVAPAQSVDAVRVCVVGLVGQQERRHPSRVLLGLIR